MIDQVYAAIGRTVCEAAEKHIATFTGGNIVIIPINIGERWVDMHLGRPYRKAVTETGEEVTIFDPPEVLRGESK